MTAHAEGIPPVATGGIPPAYVGVSAFKAIGQRALESTHAQPANPHATSHTLAYGFAVAQTSLASGSRIPWGGASQRIPSGNRAPSGTPHGPSGCSVDQRKQGIYDGPLHEALVIVNVKPQRKGGEPAMHQQNGHAKGGVERDIGLPVRGGQRPHLGGCEAGSSLMWYVMAMLKKLRNLRLWFIVLIPTTVTYITLALFFGAGLGLRLKDVLEVVSFLLLVAVPAVLIGLLTVGLALIGGYGWTWWQERRKAKDPRHQLFLLADEIERCKCLIRSISSPMTAEELTEYRETVQEELRILASRLESLEIRVPLIHESDETSYTYLRDLYSPWRSFLTRLHVRAKHRDIEGAKQINSGSLGRPRS